MLCFLLAHGLNILWAQNPEDQNSTTEIPSNTIFMESNRERIEFQLENKEYLIMPAKNPGTWQILQLMPDGSFEKLEGAVKSDKQKEPESKLPARTKKEKIEPTLKSSENPNDKIEKVASADDNPVQAITQVVKQSLKIGKVVGSRYDAYKKADRIGRIQIVKDLIFGSNKKEAKKEESAADIKIRLFQNEDQLEIFTNQYPMELEALDENGDRLLKLGNVSGNYAELALAEIPKGTTWLKFSKDGQLKILKYE
jgi:hypothetical protein